MPNLPRPQKPWRLYQGEAMKEEWLFQGAVVPVDVETTQALVAEIKRLIGIIGGMALNQQRTWVGLTDEEIKRMGKLDLDSNYFGIWYDFAKAIEAKLKEKNT
jgi:hypothetical protein